MMEATNAAGSGGLTLLRATEPPQPQKFHRFDGLTTTALSDEALRRRNEQHIAFVQPVM